MFVTLQVQREVLYIFFDLFLGSGRRAWDYIVGPGGWREPGGPIGFGPGRDAAQTRNVFRRRRVLIFDI